MGIVGNQNNRVLVNYDCPGGEPEQLPIEKPQAIINSLYSLGSCVGDLEHLVYKAQNGSPLEGPGPDSEFLPPTAQFVLSSTHGIIETEIDRIHKLIEELTEMLF